MRVPGGQFHDLVHHQGHRQRRDGPAALGAEGLAHPGEEHPQVVVDFGGGGHGGAGVPGGAALLDGDGRGQALDVLHVGLVHEFQELPGVGRQALHVAPLPLGIENVEGQGGFPRAAYPGDNDEAVAGQLHVDVFQVVLPGAPDDDLVGGPGSLVQDLKNSRRGGCIRMRVSGRSRMFGGKMRLRWFWACGPAFF